MHTRIAFSFFFFLLAGLYAQNVPVSYDLRDVDDENFVTVVRNQEGYNSWAFATFGSMESNLLITDIWELSGEDGEPDLSEYHMSWWNGFTDFHNTDTDNPEGTGVEVHSGGNYKMAAAYLMRGSGAVRQVDASSYSQPPQQMNSQYHYFHPRHIVWLNAGEELEHIDQIKQSIMNHGAVASVIAYDNDYIDFVYNHYQPPDTDDEPNLGITIIGWDDRKITQAPQRGAWICKNSWGSSWGNNGYFYVSYYDKYAGKHPDMGAVVFTDVRKPDYDNYYYHDYHGWVDTTDLPIAIFNRFVAGEDEYIKSISFVTAEKDVNYTLEVYKHFENGVLKDLVYSHQGEAEHPGYHQSDLSPVVYLEKDKPFYIYLRLSGGLYAYDRTHVPEVLNTEAQGPVESESEPGQSFYLSNTGWKDFYDFDDPSGFQQSGNFCIKAYTMNNPGTSNESRINQREPDVKLVHRHITAGPLRDTGFISIFNLNGQLILSKQLSHLGMHEIPFHQKGLFIYRLKDGSSTYSGKLFAR